MIERIKDLPGWAKGMLCGVGVIAAFGIATALCGLVGFVVMVFMVFVLAISALIGSYFD